MRDALISRRLGVALAAAFSIAAVAAPSAMAASSTTTQNVIATVQSQVNIGNNGDCVQNQSTENFGTLTAQPQADVYEPYQATPAGSANTVGGNTVWTLCVTANNPVTITASGTNDLSDGNPSGTNGGIIPIGKVAIGTVSSNTGDTAVLSAPGFALASGALGGGSYLTAPVTLAAGSYPAAHGIDPAGLTEVDYQYGLDLPANQDAGSYTGGLVTFTATSAG